MDSDDCTFSLETQFFEKPLVHKVKPLCQEAASWQLEVPPTLSQIPATQVMKEEAESLSNLYSFPQTHLKFQPSFKESAALKVLPSNSVSSFSNKHKENEEPQDGQHSTSRYDGLWGGEGFRDLSRGPSVRSIHEDQNPQDTAHAAIGRRCLLPDCSTDPALSRSLFKVPALNSEGDSSNTDDLSGSSRSQTASRLQTFRSHVTVATVPPPPTRPPWATVSQAAPPFPPGSPLFPHPVGSSAATGQPPQQVGHAGIPDKGTKRALVPPMMPQPLHIQDSSRSVVLRPVSEIPAKFRTVFKEFPYFNYVQSKALDDVLYTDKNFVACAPTGSGKTVLFELAIIHLLMESSEPWRDVKAVYMAPIKALCSQCFESWRNKFGPLGLNCKELTGDTEIDDFFEIQDSHIILTTPEKWDSLTRKWKDNCLLQLVRLFLIDEVHVVKDATRGATLEVVVSRMKAVHAYRTAQNPDTSLPMRFVAVSATIPNISDIADWLSNKKSPATYLDIDESHRPVKLRKVVLGFPCSPNQTAFKFDLSLNYKMANVIQTYSDQKPALVFCSTRKGAQQSAMVLAKDTRFNMTFEHKQRLIKHAQSVLDSKLRDLMMLGVGYHHAGVDLADRKLVEKAFTLGDLPVLFTTRTLAMGVNLPAHLVVIKSTMQYVAGSCEEYSEADMLQMVGRAGRPQFDTSATAVIMTKVQTKDKYMNLMNGMEIIESSLHSHLVEHLNAEIVLQTISDVNMALDWIRSTFLYIRALKNPVHYGFSADLDRCGIEAKLQELCLKNLNSLSLISLINMDEDINIKPTEAGRLMARYCVAFETMKQFSKVAGTEDLADLIKLLSKSREFSDIQLRVNERRSLNTLNRDKNRITIRFPMEGKIKNSEMKVNCLIQAQLGSITVPEFGLTQDMAKIFRNGMRISKCLTEFLSQRSKTGFSALLNSLILAKCFKAKLWENSPFVSKQLEKIGQTLSTAMVNAGLTTFSKIEQMNPREIELIVNKHPPFGNQLRELIAHLPKYEVILEQLPRYNNAVAEIVVKVNLKNQAQLQSRRTAPDQHYISLLIGDCDNNVVFLHRFTDTGLLKSGCWAKKIEVLKASNGDEISVNLISSDYVGLDIHQKFSVYYSGARSFETDVPSTSSNVSVCQSRQSSILTSLPIDKTAKMENTKLSADQDEGNKRRCNHHCKKKDRCGHDCCKVGVTLQRKRPSNQECGFSSYLRDLRSRCDSLEQATVKRFKMKTIEESMCVSMEEFSYKPKQKLSAHSSYRGNHFNASAGPHSDMVDLKEESSSMLSNVFLLDDFDNDGPPRNMYWMNEEPVQATTDNQTQYQASEVQMTAGYFAGVNRQAKLNTNSTQPNINILYPAVSKRPTQVSDWSSHGNNESFMQIPAVSFDLGNEWDNWTDFDDENLVHASETLTSCAPSQLDVQPSVEHNMPGSDITSVPSRLSYARVNNCVTAAGTPLRSISAVGSTDMRKPGTLSIAGRPQNRITPDWNREESSLFSDKLAVEIKNKQTESRPVPLTQQFDFFSTMSLSANDISSGISTKSKEEELFLGIFDGIF